MQHLLQRGLLRHPTRAAHGRTDGALVRFTTPMLDNETDADAEARIEALMAEVLPRLPRFIPEYDPTVQ